MPTGSAHLKRTPVGCNLYCVCQHPRTKNTCTATGTVTYWFVKIGGVGVGNWTLKYEKVYLSLTYVEDNDVNNQRDSKTFSFINLFKSAQHVSGDKFGHPQEHFLTLCTAFCTIHRSAAEAVHCTKSCIYSQKVLKRMGEFVARNILGWFKEINKWKICCILLAVYIVVLMMHGYTNIRFICGGIWTISQFDPSVWRTETKLAQVVTSKTRSGCCTPHFSPTWNCRFVISYTLIPIFPLLALFVIQAVHFRKLALITW